MKTLVICGSIRSRENRLDILENMVREKGNLSDYLQAVSGGFKASNVPCNCDILAGVCYLAMMDAGSDVELYSLTRLFPHREAKVSYDENRIIDTDITTTDTLSLNPDELELFFCKIKSADGILLITPVYFGDRSSVANKLLQLSGIHDLLKGKVFGAVAVGAKRNGGQETTIIYCLLEALSQGALVVGNGPPTSQYGGTAVGGFKGTVLNDDWGLCTAYGTGTRVAQVANLIRSGTESDQKPPIHILVLVSMDDESGLLQSFLSGYLAKLSLEHTNVCFKLKNILDLTIYRCLGCKDCPPDGKFSLDHVPTPGEHAHCIIKNKDDAMEEIHDDLLSSDAIIVAGLNVKEHKHLVYRYQVLIERTRYIRRNNFELANKSITSFTLNQVGARINSLHEVKTVTSYIRHNSIIHKPIEAFILDGKVMDDGMEDMKSFIREVEYLAKGISIAGRIPAEYATKGIGGY